MRVGVFDSGVGGLSVWREIARQWPALATVYVADQAHVPYGTLAADTIRTWSRGITRFLQAERCDAVVVACNTASAAALQSLRAEFAPLPFVGMEPAVKPAAAESRSHVAAVLATPATFQGDLFATTVERFAAGVRLVPVVCAGLVERIEAGDVDGPATAALLRVALQPAIAAGADTVVLACTHYPFVRAMVEREMGPGVAVIDPAPAVARQVGRVLGLESSAAASEPGASAAASRASATAMAPATTALFVTTGDVARFAAVARRLLGHAVDARPACWDGERIVGP